MSGSNRYFSYVSDNGNTYAIYASKDNVIGANGGGAPATLAAVTLPRNIKPRYALFSSDDGLVKRKVPILTPTIAAALSSTTSFTPYGETVTVRLTAYRGEKINLPKLADTGRTV